MKLLPVAISLGLVLNDIARLKAALCDCISFAKLIVGRETSAQVCLAC